MKMYVRRPRFLVMILPMLLVVGLSITLSGCGDGGGGGGNSATVNTPTSTTTPTPTPTTNSVVSAGPITSFGSIVVDGRKYDTTQAEIRFEDRLAQENELRLGMFVQVEGVDDNGVLRARRVAFRKNAEGLIERVDIANNTLVVLGQTVQVDGLTVLEDRNQPGSVLLGDLATNQFVEISGLANANGVIVATRIERKTGFVAGVTELEVRGTISNLNSNVRTFTLGSLTVNFSNAAVTGTLSNGVFVEVRGTQAVRGGALTATRVAVEDRVLPGAAGAEVEVEGLVINFTSTTVFSVNGQAVQTNAQTQFENGTAAQIALNARLEVEGQINASGTLIARKVSFRSRSGGNIRIVADVDAVTATGDVVTVLGIQVHLNDLTQFKDDVGGERDFNRVRLRLRDRVDIRASIDAQGNIVATRVRRKQVDNEMLLQAQVDQVANPNLVLHGVEVRTDGTTQFMDSNNVRITAAQFFAAAQVNTLVKARGVLLRGTPVALRATQVELEDPNKDDDL